MKQLSIVLLLISLIYATPHPTTKITKKLGDDATLSCKRNNTEDYLVLSTWYKEPDSIILLAVKNDVVYFDNYTSDKVSYDSPYDNLVTTITVKSLTSADAGTYICAFFISLTNDTDTAVDYEEHYIELIVTTDNVSTIDVILSESTTKQDTISFTEEPRDITSESNTQAIETSESITYNVEDHEYNVTTSNNNITPSPEVVAATTTVTTNDDNLYDVYDDPVLVSSKPTVESGITSDTPSTKKYTTRDFVEIFGVVSLILLLSMVIFCIIYYYYNKRSSSYGAHIA
ncbi:hemagglutinin [Volepox virus]|uniref:Hemagglutinin n=1 Tax=Volepox virus TaxID=28874 RepID=Q8BEI3_9POXV|nr:hemagglutinin [Volepox virus]AAN47079.1 hemagglutinin [Volepox virus]AOP31867.1 hemagglutinin [Volepox virus]